MNMVQYSLELKDDRFPINICVRRWNDYEHHNGELVACFKYIEEAQDYIKKMTKEENKRKE